MQYDDKNQVIKLHIFLGNRDIRKVRRRQHQYPEFGHTQGEISKKPAKKYFSIQGGGESLMVLEFHRLCFFLSASTAAT
jgi:hypothetical protein